MAEPILIIGASGRAAAFSTLRAGLEPHVIDLFADADLSTVADVRVIPGRKYPQGFVELAREFPPMPFMYTGGLENHPDVIAAIAAERPLIGNGPEVLAKVRDPFALSKSGVRCPQVRRFDDPPQQGRWLYKPLRGSGGTGIRFAPGGRCRDDHFFQEFIAGESRSAIFLDDQMLGVTQQLVGEPWLHAPRFGYCGSIGPLEISPAERTMWQHLGDALVKWSGLRGVFGIDAIVRDGLPWLIEVNPRYSASVEVVEWRTPPVRAGALNTNHPRPHGRDSPTLAKAIYYAPHSLTFPQNGPWKASVHIRSPFEVPEFADIPHAGTTIPRGRPVMTIFGRDETDLHRKACELDAIFELGHVPCR